MKLPFMVQYGCKSELPNKLRESFPYQFKKICSGADTRSLIYGEGQGHHIMFFFSYFVKDIKRGGKLKG
jgi:hypothetical protein